MPTDEYIVSPAESEQTAHSVRYFVDFPLLSLLASSKNRTYWTVSYPAGSGKSYALLADTVLGQVIENATSVVRVGSWGTTGRNLWASLARGSYAGSLVRYGGVTQPMVYAGTAQAAPMWGWVSETEEEFEPIFQEITPHDVLLVTRATSLDLTESELLPEFEDDD
jgi:hypothetical protein